MQFSYMYSVRRAATATADRGCLCARARCASAFVSSCQYVSAEYEVREGERGGDGGRRRGRGRG
eukprot:6176362-Pleurochrysis_carterae.AAC.1